MNGLAQGIASNFGPDTALAWVRAIDVPDVQYSCHALEHAIGRSAAEQKWPDFPPLISLECQYGYLHGVLQFRATKSTLDEWINTTHTYCVSLEDKPKSECLHGLGHGAAVSTPNDLAQVLLACSKIEGDDSDPCADGAMMEFADDIWQRAGLLHWETGYVDVETVFDPREIRNLCTNTPTNVASSCWRRAADVVGPTLGAYPEKISEVCNSAPLVKDRKECLYAASASAVENFFKHTSIMWPPETPQDAKDWVRAAATECGRWPDFETCFRGSIGPTFSHMYSGGLWEKVQGACLDEVSPILEICEEALKEAIVIAN